MKKSTRNIMGVVTAIALMVAGSAQAATYYWDDNSSSADFGAAGASTGTWAGPTAGPTAGWSLSTTGANVFAPFTTGTADLLNFGNGATGLAAGTITISGTVSAGNITFASGSGGIVLSGGTITLAAAETITVDNTSNTISSILAGAATSLTKAGAGTLTLAGANAYTGTTTINTGTLKLQGNAFSTKNRTYSITSGAVLSIDGATDIATGTTTINGTGTLRKTGTGNWMSSGDARDVTMSLGVGALIDVQTGASFANGGWQAFTWTSNQASMNVDGVFDTWDGNAVTIDALTGSGTITKGATTYGSPILNLGTANGSGVFSGVIQNTAGALALVKKGTGTQTLAGNNTYSGSTTVSNGTLLVNGSINSAVTVVSGAYLGGTGAITGAVTFASGARATFTNSAPLKFAGTVTLNNNTVYLTLPNNLADGTYLLATNTTSSFSGTFASVPVIVSGSSVGACTITNDTRAVRLNVAPSPNLWVSVTAPVNGRIFLLGSSVTATVSVVSGTMPYAVTFYTNSAVAWSTNSASTNLFNINLGALAGGTYTHYATVTDSVSSNATSSTNSFTLAPDTTAPTPNPMTFAVNPLARDASTVVMTATTATDALSPPVEYFFTNTVNGSNSGWILSTAWTNSGLTEGVSYGYQVKARDAVSNETQFSSVFTAIPASPTIFWDANATSANQTDGAGTWLNANQWWNGIANCTWNSTIPNNAVIGNGGAGGTLTLGTVTAGSVVLTNFTGTYTLSGGSLTQSGGITIATNAGNVTITSPVSGVGGLTARLGAGKKLILANTGNNYSGETVVSGGIAQFGNSWNDAHSIPGGITPTGPGAGSNLRLSDGGMIAVYYTFSRALGTGGTEVQFLGGTCGLTQCQGDRPAFYFGSASTEVQWGSTYFNPSVFVINDAAANPACNFEWQNKIDLNGATRIVAANSTTYGGTLSGVIRNSGVTPAGLTKAGPGLLILSGQNSFDGPVTISQGTLSINSIANVASANPLGKSPAAAANLLLGNGTTLQYTGGAATCDRGFTINGTANNDSASLDASGSGALVLNNTASPAYGAANQSRKLILTGTSTYTNTLAASIADNGSGPVSLTKTGTGTWVLTASSSFSGNTIVTNGMLRITGRKVLSPLTSVYLSTGSITGKVDLAFSGTQLITALYINGVKQSIGTPVGANGTTIIGTGFLSSGGGTLISFR